MLIFAGIVAVGILGEAICSVKSVFKHFALQANEKLTEAERDREAKAKSDQFDRDVADANARAKEAEQKTAEIYERFRWRHVDFSRAMEFATSLRDLSKRGFGVNRVWYSVRDPEAAAYTIEIRLLIFCNTFGSPGDMTAQYTQYAPTERVWDGSTDEPGEAEIPIGVCLFVSPQDILGTPEIDRFRQLLSLVGVPIHCIKWNSKVPHGTVDIEVGVNPISAMDPFGTNSPINRAALKVIPPPDVIRPPEPGSKQ